MEEIKRKEVWLHKKVISRLEKLAKEKKWSLKFYMEDTLTRESEREPIPTYKVVSSKTKHQ